MARRFKCSGLILGLALLVLSFSQSVRGDEEETTAAPGDEKRPGPELEADLELEFSTNTTEGTSAVLGQFPGVVSVRYVNDSGGLAGDHWCTGMILNRNWVLMAAHCADEQAYWKSLEKVPLVVVTGLQDASSSPEQAQVKNVTEVIVHPKYDRKRIAQAQNPSYNIALLRVTECFKDSEYMEEKQPGSELRTRTVGRPPSENRQCQAVGFGVGESNTRPLVFVSVSVKSFKDWTIQPEVCGRIKPCVSDPGTLLFCEAKLVGIVNSPLCSKRADYVYVELTPGWLNEAMAKSLECTTPPDAGSSAARVVARSSSFVLAASFVFTLGRIYGASWAWPF